LESSREPRPKTIRARRKR